MMRFYIGSLQVAMPVGPEAVAKVLAGTGSEFSDIDNRDGSHVLMAMGYNAERTSKGHFPASGIIAKGQKIIRAIDQGRGKDFSRSPEDALDDGMDEFELKGFAMTLVELANKARSNSQGISIVVFDPSTNAQQTN